MAVERGCRRSRQHLRKEAAMTPVIKISSTLVLGAVLVGPFTTGASAISVELAKTCREMAIKAYPTKPAGSTTGSAKAQREFYQNCLAKDGKVDTAPPPVAPR
jgi:hypothetical protein